MLLKLPVKKMDDILDKVELRVNEKGGNNSSVKLDDLTDFMQFSSHDTTVIPLFDFLDSNNLHMNTIPYAAQI